MSKNQADYWQGRPKSRKQPRSRTDPGIILGAGPAPESSHAIAAAIHEAEQAKIEGKPRTILFNLSGHGLIDMAAYDQYLSGDLTNYEVTDEEVANNLKDLEKII